MLLLPLRHENMQGRRWPIVTFALIALNIIAFLGTHWTIEAQDAEIPERVEVFKHLILLAATHPELKKGEDAQKLIDTISTQYPDDWKGLSSTGRKAEDAWDANMRQMDDPVELQAEMDGLSQKFQDFERNTLLAHYAFVPAHPTAISYLTCNFLHVGWLHLIGNMWFLWLAGFILEDNWGRDLRNLLLACRRVRGAGSCLVQSRKPCADARGVGRGRRVDGRFPGPFSQARN